MKVLIAIKGCERDQKYGGHQVMRETWIQKVVGPDLYFFVGHGDYPLKPDEVRLNCGDQYMDLPSKTREILKWSIERDYDYIFLCDTDTFVMPKRLLSSTFAHFDLVGLFNGAIGVPYATEAKYWAWISGGNGYWLSRTAAKLIAEAPDTGDWAEDRITGQVLGPYFQRKELIAFSDSRYGFHFDSEPYRCAITKHYCTQGYKRPFDPQWMRFHYQLNPVED